MFKGGDPIARPAPRAPVKSAPALVNPGPGLPPAMVQAVQHAVGSVGHTAQSVAQSPMVHETPSYHKVAQALVAASSPLPSLQLPTSPGNQKMSTDPQVLAGRSAQLLIQRLAESLVNSGPRNYASKPAPPEPRYSPQGGMALPPSGPDRLPTTPGVDSHSKGGDLFLQPIPNAATSSDPNRLKAIQGRLGLHGPDLKHLLSKINGKGDKTIFVPPSKYV